MAFTDAEKVDIRRFCGYPAFGSQPTQGFGYRFFTQYGTLEYKLQWMLPEEEAVIRTTYLANLTALESAIPTSSSNLDTDAAAVWAHNKHELRDREALFCSWRRKLCEFIGIEPGPGLANSGFRMVV